MVPKASSLLDTIQKSAWVAIFSLLSGCASLLPDAKHETLTPWRSYAEAQAMYEKVIPGKSSVTELKALGVDPATTPNVALLSHTDLLRRLIPSSSFDVRLLDPGLQECVSQREVCFAYEIEQIFLQRKRQGNFWLDFLNFKRQVDISGWQFDAVFVIKNDTVVYKLWSGKPSVHQSENEHSPLGPMQGVGSSMLRP